MFHRGPGFAGSPGLPFKQICSGGGRLLSALAQGIGQSRLLSPELGFPASLGPHFKWASCYLLNSSTGGAELLSPAVSFSDLGDSVSSKCCISSEPKLCVEWLLCYTVWPWDSHMFVHSAQTEPAVPVPLLRHTTVSQSLSPLSAWAAFPAVHMCSARKHGSMEEPKSCTSQEFCSWRRSCSFTHGWTGNWRCSDSTKPSSSGCHQHTWVGVLRGSWTCASAESITALLYPGNSPGLLFTFSLQFAGFGNSISCLEHTSKRWLWVRAASNATNALSRTLHSCTASFSRWGERTSVISAPGRQKTLNQHNESWWETIEASGQHRERESY